MDYQLLPIDQAVGGGDVIDIHPEELPAFDDQREHQTRSFISQTRPERDLPAMVATRQGAISKIKHAAEGEDFRISQDERLVVDEQLQNGPVGAVQDALAEAG
jgi:hypothetical protein